MRRLLIGLLLLGTFTAAFAGDIVKGRVVKVLPFFVDASGRIAKSPSLYDRDAYQAYLRQHADERSAVRFDVLWKASDKDKDNLKLQVELRGIGKGGMPRRATLEQTVEPRFFRHWNSLTLGGKDYKHFGELVAWRVTLWSGDRVLSEQKSFLW